jgi:prophage antirepressor-like protein
MDGIEGGAGVNIVPFQFDGAAVRTITTDAGEVLFVGKDVAAVLGYANETDALNKHCKGVAIRYPLQTAGGVQQARAIAEPDVLRLIVSSKPPAAERFERWVFETVLPTIRRTGSYAAAPAVPQTLAQALRLAADQAERIEAQQLQIAEQAVSVDALNRLASTDGLLTPRDAAKAVGVTPTALNRWLDAHGWTYVQGGRRHAYHLEWLQ